jgi:hypothetical protein
MRRQARCRTIVGMTNGVPTPRPAPPTVWSALAPRFGLAGSISLALNSARRRRH